MRGDGWHCTGQVSQVGLVIFDGPNPPGYSYFFMKLMSRMLGFRKLSVLYLCNTQSDLTSTFNRRQIRLCRLTGSLDVESASTLLIKSMDLQSESLPVEVIQTAGQIVQVCD